MKKWFLRTAAGLLAAVLLFTAPVSAVSAEKAAVLDTASGEFLYEKNADSRSLIASTTKIMTALLVCEQCNVLEQVTVPKEAVGIEGSSMYLKEGEVLTVQELLYGLMLSSGNDAAEALAIICGKTVENFARMMNEKAESLGMTHTHFVNPSGLDAEDHYSTPRDLAILSAYAMKNPIFAATVSTKKVTVGERYLVNHNRILWQVAGADGIKTGYTRAAGRILVSSACRHGRRLIAVTVNDPDDWQDHRYLLENGFSGLEMRQIIRKDEIIGKKELFGGERGIITLRAAEDFSFPLRKNEQIQIQFSSPNFTFAPVAEGQKAGQAYVMLNGTCIGKIPVEYGQTAERQTDENGSVQKG